MAGQTRQARPLDRTSAVPLWVQLLDDLSRRLDAGAFATHFPGEHQLCAEYRVSRHTVREALRRLRECGILDSGRGRGTRVHVPRIEQPVGALYSLFRVVESLGLEQRSEVRALDLRTEPRAAHQLGLPADSELVYLERLRLADGEPLALDHAWLPRDVAEPLLDADFTHAALYDELDRRVGVRLTSGREHIQALVPLPALRKTLQIGRTVAVFALERQGCLQNRPVEWRKSLVRGDRFSLAAEWNPGSSYQLGVAGAQRCNPG
ncbi:MAG TPA: GntR family transcriptional regulator [Pseudonocardiaceae bacterium]|jgi:GntR family transcriptional regulator|nr:GntR family transcriptional regulator [Pseudonocardiaceae bacterium]